MCIRDSASCFNNIENSCCKKNDRSRHSPSYTEATARKPAEFFVLSGSFSLRAGLLLLFKALHPIDGRQWGMSLLLNIWIWPGGLYTKSAAGLHLAAAHGKRRFGYPAFLSFGMIRFPVRRHTAAGITSCSQKRDRHRLSRFPSEYVAYSIPTSLLHWWQYCSAICTVFIAVSPPALFLLLILCRIFRKKNKAALLLSYSNTDFPSIRL